MMCSGENIDQFIGMLRQRSDNTDTFNPYRDAALAGNLRGYLGRMLVRDGRKILFVGEAPGYLGCRRTGVPFTSEVLLTECPHPFLRELVADVNCGSKSAEASAQRVWQAFRGKDELPLLWNAFPFHPHEPGHPDSNRRLRAAERHEGRKYLELMIDLYAPELLVGVGRVGEAELLALGHAAKYLRHPSHGGGPEFQAGVNEMLS